jgi:hypothetical protein
MNTRPFWWNREHPGLKFLISKCIDLSLFCCDQSSKYAKDAGALRKSFAFHLFI